jgi:hypothetical protein
MVLVLLFPWREKRAKHHNSEELQSRRNWWNVSVAKENTVTAILVVGSTLQQEDGRGGH